MFTEEQAERQREYRHRIEIDRTATEFARFAVEEYTACRREKVRIRAQTLRRNVSRRQPRHRAGGHRPPRALGDRDRLARHALGASTAGLALVKRRTRAPVGLAVWSSPLIAVVTLAAASATAVVNVPFTGVWGEKRTPVFNFPLVGVTPCPSLTINLDFAPPGTTVPGNLPTMDPFGVANPQLQNPGGCVADFGSLAVTTAGAAPRAFEVLPGFFSTPVPPPGATNRVLAILSNVLSVQTRNAFTGPQAAPLTPILTGTPPAPPNPPANWRKFRASAWATQSGRVGPSFTWCWAAGNCAGIPSATTPAVVKYRGGTHNFGGTMGLILNQAFGRLVLVGGAFVPPGGAAYLPLQTGAASVPEGRGYGAYQTIPIPSGTVFMSYALAADGFLLSAFNSTGVIPPRTIFARGFPWTTGTVFVRKTGTASGLPNYQTLSAMGSDNRTPMGMNGNINLVAGSITRTLPGGSFGLTPNISQLNLPEPGAVLQAVSAVLVLLGFQLRRSRSHRS